MTTDTLDYEGKAQFATEEPRHYDRVPSIIDHLTYIEESRDEQTGVITFCRKRLTPTEKEVYRILRYRASNGSCWRNCEDLASHVGCSKNTITEAKKALSMPFEQLEGMSLINIEKKYIRTERDGKTINKKPVHIITINNIWAFNNAFMDSLDHQNVVFPDRKEELQETEAHLAIEKLGQPGPVTLVRNLTPSPKKDTSQTSPSQKKDKPLKDCSQNWDVNKDNVNKDHCLETKTKANALARCFLASQNVEKSFDSTHNALNSLQLFGLSKKICQSLVKDYSLDALILAFLYVKEKMKKKTIDCLQGYLILTLKNRWYEPCLSL